VSLLALAACSSQGGAQNQQSPAPEGERLTIAMVIHGAASDAFWSQIQRGAQEAADKDNVELRYAGSGQVPEQATLIQNAIDSKVNGIIVTLPDPAALGPVVAALGIDGRQQNVAMQLLDRPAAVHESSGQMIQQLGV